MIFLTGAWGNAAVVEVLNTHPDWGIMDQPRIGNTSDLSWQRALDNGQFSGTITPEQWLRWLDQQPRNAHFAAVLDVPFDWAGTLKAFAVYAPKVRELGFKVAIVTQNGCTAPHQVPWDDIDAVMIGGTTEYKCSFTSAAVVDEGNARGKWTHIGRVNTFQRMSTAAFYQARSIDGTCLRFGYDKNLPLLTKWLDEFNQRLYFPMTFD